MSLTLSQKASKVKPSSTLAISAKAGELKAQGIDVVGFGAGEPDFKTPDDICNAAIDAIRNGFTKYTPASGTAELKEVICKKFNDFNHIHYDPDQIVVSNGGKHTLTNVFQAILNKGDEVIIPAPYWLSYPEMVRLNDGKPVFVRAEKAASYKVTASQIERAVTDKTKALILNSPNNPTGMIYTKKELHDIAELAVKYDFYIVSDEIYEYLIYGGEKHYSVASFSKKIYDRTITCSGLSKTYSMTGWRIGYCGAPKEIAKMMGAVQSHLTSNPNSIAQKAAVEAISGPQGTVEIMRKEFNKRRLYMIERIAAMPYVDMMEPKGAFYAFVDVSKALEKKYHGKRIADTMTLAQILLEDFHVALVPCTDFGFADHVRLSYVLGFAQIEKGMDRIESFLRTLE